MILEYSEVLQQVKRLRQNKNTIVLVTGVFDVLHQEHVLFLQKAKQQGDVLIVGLESDNRVTKLKGPNRPINHIAGRLDQMNKFPFVNVVFELPSVTDWLAFMKQTDPDVYCVSSQSPFLDSKKSICQQAGIELKIVHQHNPHISTTQIIGSKKMISSRYIPE